MKKGNLSWLTQRLVCALFLLNLWTSHTSLGSLPGLSGITPVAAQLPSGATPPAKSHAPLIRGNNLYIVGDSLTRGMQRIGFEDALRARGWAPTVHAIHGRSLYTARADARVPDAFKVLKSAPSPATNANLIILALGSNAGELNDTLFEQKIGEFIDTLRELNRENNAPIYWINLHVPQALVYTTRRNTILARMASKKNFILLDWHQYNLSHAVSYSDGVHHNSEGYREKINFLLNQLPLPPS